MRHWLGWAIIPGTLGLAVGLALNGGAAHACSCSGGQIWVMAGPTIETTDPAVDDSAFWGANGQLSARRLEVWSAGQTVNSIEYSP